MKEGKCNAILCNAYRTCDNAFVQTRIRQLVPVQISLRVLTLYVRMMEQDFGDAATKYCRSRTS